MALTVDAGVYEAKAGDTVKLKIRTTDVKEAYHAVVGFLEIDTEKFTLLSVTAGDSDDPDNENSRVYHNSRISEYMSDEKTQTVSPLYCDTENINEGVVIATLELKINNAINDGNYVIPFSIPEDCSMVNQIIAKAKNNGFDEARVLNAEYRGALIKVKN